MEIQITEESGRKWMKVEGGNSLQIDMGKVVYVSSAGLRAFLNGQKMANKNGVEMVIHNVTDTVMGIFEMTGFIDILTME